MLFTPDRTAIERLSKKDTILGDYIAKRGEISFEVYDSPFEALVSSIIAQQIATPVAETIKKRVIGKFGSLEPQNFKDATFDQLKQCGLSSNKVTYIMRITKVANDGNLEYSDFCRLTDDKISAKLLQIKGVGIWTVQMVLIFCLCRQDVISYSDYGIRRGIMNLYKLDELTQDKFSWYSKRWAPYRTIASLYLWQAAADPDLQRTRKEKLA